MINIDELEKRLEEVSKTETGKPYNKWIPETRTEMVLQSIQNCKERNLEIELLKGELEND